MRFEFSASESALWVTLEFPKWVEKLNDMLFLQEEEEDE